MEAKPERRKKQTLMKAIPHNAASKDGNKDGEAGEGMDKQTENLQTSQCCRGRLF